MPTSKNEVAVPNAGLGFNMEGAVAKADELNSIQSYDDALALIGIDKITEENAALLGWDTNPYEPVDKAQLINVPHLIVQWAFRAGDFGEYVIVHAIARLDNGTDWMVLYADGSQGIKKQLSDLTEKRVADGHDHPQQGALIRGGLNPSDYEIENAEGKQIPARTYYLSNSKKTRK